MLGSFLAGLVYYSTFFILYSLHIFRVSDRLWIAGVYYIGFVTRGGEIRFYVFLNMYSLLCFPLVLLLSFIWQ